MRLKEDKSSWNASNVIRKVTPVPEQPLNHGRRKDTKRWCRGKVGREHVMERISPPQGMFARTKRITMNVCQVCGKQDFNSMLWDGLPWDQYWSRKGDE